jgi:hypothetical protein
MVSPCKSKKTKVEDCADNDVDDQDDDVGRVTLLLVLCLFFPQAHQ